jgi:hypothetical protein
MKIPEMHTKTLKLSRETFDIMSKRLSELAPILRKEVCVLVYQPKFGTVIVFGKAVNGLEDAIKELLK